MTDTTTTGAKKVRLGTSLTEPTEGVYSQTVSADYYHYLVLVGDSPEHAYPVGSIVWNQERAGYVGRTLDGQVEEVTGTTKKDAALTLVRLYDEGHCTFCEHGVTEDDPEGCAPCTFR